MKFVTAIAVTLALIFVTANASETVNRTSTENSGSESFQNNLADSHGTAISADKESVSSKNSEENHEIISKPESTVGDVLNVESWTHVEKNENTISSSTPKLENNAEPVPDAIVNPFVEEKKEQTIVVQFENDEQPTTIDSVTDDFSFESSEANTKVNSTENPVDAFTDLLIRTILNSNMFSTTENSTDAVTSMDTTKVEVTSPKSIEEESPVTMTVSSSENHEVTERVTLDGLTAMKVVASEGNDGVTSAVEQEPKVIDTDKTGSDENDEKIDEKLDQFTMDEAKNVGMEDTKVQSREFTEERNEMMSTSIQSSPSAKEDNAMVVTADQSNAEMDEMFNSSFQSNVSTAERNEIIDTPVQSNIHVNQNSEIIDTIVPETKNIQKIGGSIRTNLHTTANANDTKDSSEMVNTNFQPNSTTESSALIGMNIHPSTKTLAGNEMIDNSHADPNASITVSIEIGNATNRDQVNLLHMTTEPLTNRMTSEMNVVSENDNGSSLLTSRNIKSYNFLVYKEPHLPCILAYMSVTLKIPYNTVDKKTVTTKIQVPVEAVVSGSCEDNASFVALRWPENTEESQNSIVFEIKKDAKSFYVNSVRVNVLLDEDQFPLAAETVVAGNSSTDLRLFSASLKDGVHVCQSVTEVQCGKIGVVIKDVSLIAYNDERDVSYRKEERCSHKVQNAKLIGTVIGIVSIIGLVLALAWCKSRNNSFRSELP